METIIITLKQYNADVVDFEDCYRVNGILEVYKDSLKAHHLKGKKPRTFNNEDERILYCINVIQSNQRKNTFYYKKAEIEVNPKFRIPFGKYKGQLLSDIPRSYLEWLRDNQKKLPKQIEIYLEGI